MAERIKKIVVSNFRCFNHEQEIETDADIILLTGKNGTGKTSLLLAITLFLNGYDSKIFNAISLINSLSDKESKNVEIRLEGILPGISNQSYIKTEKEWSQWTSPFLSNPSANMTALVRVASSYFQDKDEELASSEFLSYLTGSGNRTEQIKDWLKQKTEYWKKEKKVLQPEKNWDEERKKAIKLILKAKERLPEEYKNNFSNIMLLNNENLSKSWQSQLVNLGKNYGVSLNEYNSFFLDEFRNLNQKAKATEELKKKSSIEKLEEKKRKTFLLLESLMSFPDESIDIILPKEWDALKIMTDSLTKEKDRLSEEKVELDKCEEQNSAIGDILSVLEDNIEKAIDESMRLEKGKIPIPKEISDTIKYLYVKNYDDLITRYNEWQNEVRNKIKEINTALMLKNNLISKKNKLLELLSLLFEYDPTLFDIPNKMLSKGDSTQLLNSENDFHLDFPAETTITALNMVDEALRDLQKIELEYENYQIELKNQEKTNKAKEFAEKWSDLLSKETQISSVLSRTMNEIELDEIESFLQNLLTIFSLPDGFTKVIFSKTGTGKNQRLLPKLAEKIDFFNLSTGQKNLFALAWTITLNNSFRNKIGHNVMIFDDITTSLDLNQLIPVCLLFRKLAYCEKEESKRQLFISCHHEDLTNYLIDNLIPPAGRSMKVLEFKDFTKEKGPEIEPWDVISSSPRK